jgi:glycerol-3-phosphate O-acyltransferase
VVTVKQPDFPPKAQAAAGPRHFRRLLRGSFHHYSTIVHGRFSFLLDRLFAFLFGRVVMSDADRAEIRRLAEQGTLCYVMRSPSKLEYLLFAFKFRREGLPYPQFCHYLSIYWWQSWMTTLRRIVGVVVSLLERKEYPNPYANGFVANLVVNRVPMLLPVHSFGGLPRRFGRGRRGPDPLVELTRIRRETNRPILLAPLVTIYGRRPDRDTRSMLDLIAGPSDNPGRLRRLWMFLSHRKTTFIRLGQAQSLEDLEEAVRMKIPAMVDAEPETAYHVRRTLLERIETERRIVLGPARKSRTEMIEMVLHDRGFVAALMDYCKKNDQPFIETRRRARRYLEEMAADLRPTAMNFLRWVLDRLLPRVYQSIKVDTDGLEQVRKVMRQMPVVFVPCHKSHIDYLILGYMLDRNQINLPLTVSGINLNFWPVGSLFRGNGAFFIRRAFRGKRIYTLCLTKYLEMILRGGLSLTFFVEGGRSRVGKLLPPKTGFLQYLLQAGAGANRQEVAFVPVSISYERIFEERFYTNEAAGKPNEGETLRTMLRHRRLLAKSRGRVWLDFAKPITLSDLLWVEQTSLALAVERRRRDVAQKIAHRVVYSINQLQQVTPYAIVAEALLAGTRRGVPAEVVDRRYRLLRDYLDSTGAAITETPVGVKTILATMVAEKVLSFEEDEQGEEPPFYFLEESRRLPLTIYANTVVPHHQTMSLLALAFLGAREPLPAERLFEDFRFLVWLLKREFVFGPSPDRQEADDRSDWERALGVFEAEHAIEKRDGRLLLTPDGHFAAETFAAVARAYVESYHLAARTLLSREAEAFAEKELIQSALKKGARLVSVGELDHPEAVHKMIVENAVRHYADLGLLRSTREIGDKTKAAALSYQVADFVQLRQIVERTGAYLPAVK